MTNSFKWLASRSVLGGFATAVGLGLVAMAFPPGSMHDTLADVAHGPAVLLAGAMNSVEGGGPPPPVSTIGLFNALSVLFYTVLWYVLLSVIVQIKGDTPPPRRARHM
ncbi:MAG TPA: hypothetical protein VME68_05115 [Acidobacteriaceae bacterium]|nr:hypothetical protein [Acidobacteriaceae bacterium]